MVVFAWLHEQALILKRFVYLETSSFVCAFLPFLLVVHSTGVYVFSVLLLASHFSCSRRRFRIRLFLTLVNQFANQGNASNWAI